jgi:hypothetical protein
MTITLICRQGETEERHERDGERMVLLEVLRCGLVAKCLSVRASLCPENNLIPSEIAEPAVQPVSGYQSNGRDDSST